MHFAKKHLAAFAATGLFLAASATIARADEWDKRTVITIDNPVQLPTVVLQPGTYVMKLLNSPADRHIVQVFDKNEQHLITTVLAINNYRLEPKGKSTFTFWEMPAGNPPALRAWFYPGDVYGQEFAYPKKMAAEIARLNKTSVPTAGATTAEEMKTAPITSTSELGDQNQLDKKTYTAPTETAQASPPPPEPQSTAPQPEPAAPPARAPEPEPKPEAQAPAPAPAPAQVPSELPHTGSDLPLIGLIGVASLAGYVLLSRKLAR